MPADVTSTAEPPSFATPDTYDVLTEREEDALRALKSAIVGLFLLPLQVYTSWLLWRVTVSRTSLRPRYFWYAAIAASIMIPDVLISSGLLFVLFYAPETFDGSLPPP